MENEVCKNDKIRERSIDAIIRFVLGTKDLAGKLWLTIDPPEYLTDKQQLEKLVVDYCQSRTSEKLERIESDIEKLIKIIGTDGDLRQTGENLLKIVLAINSGMVTQEYLKSQLENMATKDDLAGALIDLRAALAAKVDDVKTAMATKVDLEQARREIVGRLPKPITKARRGRKRHHAAPCACGEPKADADWLKAWRSGS